MKKIEYPYIVAWGRMLGSFTYYIDNQVATAKADGAPATAIYKNQDGGWEVFENIGRAEVKADVQQRVERLLA